jgi:GH24 family phage-related lysozyme (muramidase)
MEKSEYLQPAIDLIKEFEGLYLKAYLDPVSIPTIGYGTIVYSDGRKVKLGDKITKKEAEGFLLYELFDKSRSIEKMIKVDYSRGEFCALCSFAYNLGLASLKSSTLLKKLNNNKPKADVAEEFARWVKAGGKILPGLVRRREAEKALFLSKV